jgi:hypothetical protein
LEARWRIARHWAGQGRFEQADELLAEAQVKLAERLKLLDERPAPDETFFSLFRLPPDSVMTEFKLAELQRKISQLRALISSENRTDEPASAKRLAEFAMLNPHAPDYAERLDRLLQQADNNDPLRDNILLARTRLVADDQLRAERLGRLHEELQDTDGGMQALYELAILKIHLWRQQSDSNLQQKKKYLADARATLTSFLSLYPDSICAEQVRKNLDDLPAAD